MTSGHLAAAFVVGGYDHDWPTTQHVAAFRKLAYLAVLDLLPNRLTAVAHAVLPGASFAEKDGCFVNHAGLCQAIKPAIRPPEDARTDGRILMELAGRHGLFNAALLRKEIAQAIPYFGALAAGDLGEYGVSLGASAPELAGAGS
jgi:NADH-quinone oxidoreductase subunit G